VTEREAQSPPTNKAAAQPMPVPPSAPGADAEAGPSGTPQTQPRADDAKVEVGVNTHAVQLPTAQCRVWLDVPFHCKEMAKALRAKWDDDEHAWYVPPDTDLRPFAQWIAGNKVFLALPFERNEEGKSLGARFDKKRKRWFVGTHTDLKPFEQWLPAILPPGAWNSGTIAPVHPTGRSTA